MSAERKISYRLVDNPYAKGELNDKFILQAYDGCGWTQDLYVGNHEKCSHLAANGTYGALTVDDFVPVITACVSYFFDESGSELVALITSDHKVFLGRRGDYDNHGHYFKKNYPLIFVSNNEESFICLAGEDDGPYSRREMREMDGVFDPGELNAFLQLGLYTKL